MTVNTGTKKTDSLYH